MHDTGGTPMKSKKPIQAMTTRQRPTRGTDSGTYLLTVSDTLHEQIAVRAYKHYERCIRQGPLDDWLQAEREILGQQHIQNGTMTQRAECVRGDRRLTARQATAERPAFP